VRVLFGSANTSYAFLFQAAATEACSTIQKHWRLYQEREVLKKLKAHHRSLDLCSSSAKKAVELSPPKLLSCTLEVVEADVETSEIVGRAWYDSDLVNLGCKLRSDFEGLELGNCSPKGIEVCHVPSQAQPPPTASTPTRRRRPRLGKKISASTLVEDASSAVKPEDSEEVAVPPRRQHHLAGKKSIDAPAMLSSSPAATLSSSLGAMCTVSHWVEMVPSPPPRPSQSSKRRPSVAKKTHMDSNLSNLAVWPAPPALATMSTPLTGCHSSHPEKKSTKNYLTQAATIKMDTVDSNSAMDETDIPTPMLVPRRHLSKVKPKTMKQHTVATGGFLHPVKDTQVHRMDENEDGMQSAQASSPARGCQALGVEIFNLDSGVESRTRRPKSQKISKPKIATFLEPSWQVSPATIAGESVTNRGVSMPATSGRTAMELDLGICPTPKTQVDSVRLSFDTPRKTSFKSSVLPSLGTPEKSAGRIAWSVKMAHSSTPRGGHQSVF